MRVYMINSHFSSGGPPRIMNGIYDALITRGIECRIAAAREKQYAQKDSYLIEPKGELYKNVLLSRLFDNEGLNAKEATKLLIADIKQYNPDVIHLHNIHGYYLNYEVLFGFLKTCGKKIVWTLHDCWPFTGHSAYCDTKDCVKWEHGCNNCPLKNWYPKALIDRSRMNWKKKRSAFLGVPNMTLVSPSKWLASLIQKSFLSSYKLEVIHNGIDTAVFQPKVSSFKKDYRIEDKFMLLGIASPWTEMKGFGDFINLSNMLKERCVIVMIGLSEKEKRLLPSNVIGLERTANTEELASIYSAADLFLNLSYCENYPTVNVEAISCGTPVLTYKTGGSVEIVEKTGGIIIERGDILGVLNAIKEYMVSNPNKPSISINRKDLDNNTMLDAYLRIIQE